MADNDTPPNEATPETGKPATELTSLRFEARKGQGEIELPIDKVKDMARMGLDYHNKMRELKEERAELEADRKARDIGKDFVRLRDENPELARRIFQMANGQDPQPPENGAAAQFDMEQLTDVEKQLMAQTQALQAQLREMQGEVKSVSGNFSAQQESLRAKDIQSQIATEARAVGWGDEDVQLFGPVIGLYLQQNPTATASEAVHAVQTQEADRQRLKTERLNRAKDQNMRFKTEKPGSGFPRAASTKEYKSDDLKSGKILGDALESVKGYFKDW